MIIEKPPAVAGYTASKKLSRPLLRQTILLAPSLMVFHSVYKIPTTPSLKEYLNQLSTIERVPLEAHIIVKCGNAKTALVELVLPTIERAHDKVAFRRSYTAK
ncbi:hypothetical protein BDW42DRAFT_174470 [Aspergillus taichungensis]|uniref:Uncharacterized protein n=1 Tax=Aspergillus taichungensis TaxID=482145 RepID=A0A2J5HN33_9EURO|nr:hypothetical protein BDW42DRAFT_174470 [Aspergillus taichungensis]